jgi:hypothetical protein
MLYLFIMKDAYVISGEKIEYNKEEYIIGNVYFIPGNSELFVQLKKNGCSLNVRLKEIIEPILSIKKSFNYDRSS